MIDPRVRAALEAVLRGAIASAHESDVLEFKTVGRSLDDAVVDLSEASACFANAAGGSVVVGVQDHEPGPAAFVGSPLDPVRTQRRIYELTDPHLIVTVEDLDVAGVSVTVITVPRSPDVHQVRGRATERVGATCVPMSSARIHAVLTTRTGRDWSADDSGSPVDRVSPVAAELARRRLREAPDQERRAWAELPIRDLASRLGLLATSGQLNNAGALLLTDQPALVDYTHRKARSGELDVNERLTGTGLEVLLRTLELIDTRTDRTAILLATGAQLFVADLPDDAVREAVVNAVMHRDYADLAPIQVEHAPTRLAVTSPGDFVSGVTPANVLTVTSRSRNPALSAAIRALNLAETAGVGVDRMYAAMTALGHRPPIFEAVGGRVTVSLLGGAPNAWVARFVSTLPERHQHDPDTLLVLFSLLARRTVTAQGLAATLQRPADEVESILRRLLADDVGLLDQTRNSVTRRFGTYRLRGAAVAALGPAVAYRQRTGDDTDRKIVEVVRDLGQVTGRVVQAMFDVAAPTASAILADLVGRGILVKTSKATRGPGVTYGPGPRFPRRSARGRATPTGPSATDRREHRPDE